MFSFRNLLRKSWKIVIILIEIYKSIKERKCQSWQFHAKWNQIKIYIMKHKIQSISSSIFCWFLFNLTRYHHLCYFSSCVLLLNFYSTLYNTLIFIEAFDVSRLNGFVDYMMRPLTVWTCNKLDSMRDSIKCQRVRHTKMSM